MWLDLRNLISLPKGRCRKRTVESRVLVRTELENNVHKEQLHNLNTSPSNVRAITSIEIRRVGPIWEED
jgi:hypothetical protein